jgi:lipid II:glycine glycyltransferase (peptidoglycan interpeptide bridge formation enzyme)
MYEKTYKRQNREPPHPFRMIETIVNKSIERKQGRIYTAYTEDNALQSAIFVINDSQTSYYLLGGNDYSLKNINSNAVLLWHAIRDALAEGRSFDFEGSMNEGIEHFFRSFGGEQTPYFRIYKVKPIETNSLKIFLKSSYRFVKKALKSW